MNGLLLYMFEDCSVTCPDPTTGCIDACSFVGGRVGTNRCIRRIRLKLARARQAVDLVFGGEGAMGHGKSLGRQQQGARPRFLT